jgi:8-oxo-dGTP pyrophosphatase MutT (NUDIX family)
MDLEAALRSHVPDDQREAEDLGRILEFLARHPDPFDRRISEGHLTGSALVLSRSRDRVLLLHHRKLDRWLQPGGHAEPGEASGEALRYVRPGRPASRTRAIRAPLPLDVDVHAIPAPGEPAHAHLDLRYLVLAPDGAAIARLAEETNDLRWFGWEELPVLDLDHGLSRALAKARRVVR